ncbi:hypothetical protein ADUPG1_006067 [Aduncisulcus paluster]|uniref:Uncharacterized protein n=1 Tax=Aduncisulcus paluster TaxID=2918883 RepID=A0ABQ5KL84_9EUKA|nr:hypothetical protein ADUPG1_006067 [Aduncisulcus paluster]
MNPFSVSELKSLIISIKKTSNVSKLFSDSSRRLRLIFKNFASSSSTPSFIISNRELFSLCFECLSVFIGFEETLFGTSKHLSIVYRIGDLIPMLKVESVLRKSDFEKYQQEKEAQTTSNPKDYPRRVNEITMSLFRILRLSLPNITPLKPFLDAAIPHLSPLLAKILSLGQSQKFLDPFVKDILETLNFIAFTEDNPTKNSLLSIIIPHILPWMKKYPAKQFFFLWMKMLKNVSLEKDNYMPHKDRSSQLWFVFHPVLDVVKNPAFCGIKYDEHSLICCLILFSNLSCIPSQAIEVYDCLKDNLLDIWFGIVKGGKEKPIVGDLSEKTEIIHKDVIPKGNPANNIKEKFKNPVVECLCRLVSILAQVPLLTPQISLKYDDIMVWGRENGAYFMDYERYYCSSCSDKESSILLDSIQCCFQDQTALSALYKENRDAILSVFTRYQSKIEMSEHKKEIMAYFWCLKRFCSSSHFPTTDGDDLVEIFIDHMSRVEESSKGMIDEGYCMICLKYAKDHDYFTEIEKAKMSAFFNRILPSIKRILERRNMIRLNKNPISSKLASLLYIFSRSSCSSILLGLLTLIKPYLREWYIQLPSTHQCQDIMRNIVKACSSNSERAVLAFMTPLKLKCQKTLCSDPWPIFDLVLDSVKKQRYFDFLDYFSYPCYQQTLFLFHICHYLPLALETFDMFKDHLDEWFEDFSVTQRLHRTKTSRGLWLDFFAVMSEHTSIIPQISPKYDEKVWWGLKYCPYGADSYSIDQYSLNIASYVSTLNTWKYLHSIPFICLIPTIELSLTPDFSNEFHVATMFSIGIYFNFPGIKRALFEFNIREAFSFCSVFSGASSDLKHLRTMEHKYSFYYETPLLSGSPDLSDYITHSSLLQYKPLRRILAFLPIAEERPLRQSICDFIEQTGAGVELLFDDATISFDGYEQEKCEVEKKCYQWFDLDSDYLEEDMWQTPDDLS